MATELRPFDAAAYLDDVETMAAYLNDALDEGDIGEFLDALAVVARAKEMTERAGTATVSRTALSSASSPADRGDLTTVAHLLKRIGLELHVEASSRPKEARTPVE